MSKTYKQCPSCEAKAKEVIEEEHELDEYYKDISILIDNWENEGAKISRNSHAVRALLKYVKERI